MKNRLLTVLLLCASLGASLAHAATEIAGVRFDDKTQLANTDLYLNGAGERAKFFIHVYAIGLYLNEKKATPAEILALKGPKRLQIVPLRDLSAEQFIDALSGGLQKNLSEAEIAPLKASMEEFKATLLSLKTAAKGKVLTLDWLPDSGLRLSVDGKAYGKDLADEAFYRALLKIWLGHSPAQDDLKDALLGKQQ